MNDHICVLQENLPSVSVKNRLAWDKVFETLADFEHGNIKRVLF